MTSELTLVEKLDVLVSKLKTKYFLTGFTSGIVGCKLADWLS